MKNTKSAEFLVVFVSGYVLLVVTPCRRIVGPNGRLSKEANSRREANSLLL